MSRPRSVTVHCAAFSLGPRPWGPREPVGGGLPPVTYRRASGGRGGGERGPLEAPAPRWREEPRPRPRSMTRGRARARARARGGRREVSPSLPSTSVASRRGLEPREAPRPPHPPLLPPPCDLPPLHRCRRAPENGKPCRHDAHVVMSSWLGRHGHDHDDVTIMSIIIMSGQPGLAALLAWEFGIGGAASAGGRSGGSGAPSAPGQPPAAHPPPPPPCDPGSSTRAGWKKAREGPRRRDLGGADEQAGQRGGGGGAS